MRVAGSGWGPRVLPRVAAVISGSTRRLLRLIGKSSVAPVGPASPPSGGPRAGGGLVSTRCCLQRGAILMVKDFRARGFDVDAVDLSRRLGTPLDSSFPD